MFELSPGVITILMFVFLMLFLASGLPVAFVLGGLGVMFCFFLWGPQSLVILAYNIYDMCSNFLLIAVPLFVFMGLVLERSGIADDLFNAVNIWLGRFTGGLGVGVVGICVLIAAMVGLLEPAMVTMGIIALPAMLKRGYDKRLCVGTIMSAASLGFLIPPSVTALFVALFAKVSVGKVFMAGVGPGLLLASLYVLYIVIRARVQPQLAPKVEQHYTIKEMFACLRGLILPAFVVVAVLGSILTGFATPSESAGVGAVAAILCAVAKRTFSWKLLRETLRETFVITAFIMWIVGAATVFGKIYDGLGATTVVEQFLQGVHLGPWGILIIMQFSLFFFGMVLDDVAIFFILFPLYLPIAVDLGFDRLWFAMLWGVNMQMAFITPPFGYSLFLMKGIAPKEISMGDIWLSCIPYVGLMLVGLILCMIFPEIILWLPEVMLGK